MRRNILLAVALIAAAAAGILAREASAESTATQSGRFTVSCGQACVRLETGTGNAWYLSNGRWVGVREY